MTWTGSNRKAELPPHWAAIRARILRRDGYRCTWTGCNQPASDVDHIGDNMVHDFDNLRSLCSPHHAKRTARQGVDARASLPSRPNLRLRPNNGTHPGLH